MSDEERSTACNPLATPKAEVQVDEALVTRLLKSQFSEAASATVRKLDEGWDNIMFRVGENWIARMPRRQLGADLISVEQEWLPRLSTRLLIPIPVPICFGKPEFGYPWAWSVVPWIAGQTADMDMPTADQVEPFVGFLQALHAESPYGAPKNDYRGVPLALRKENVEKYLAELQEKTDLVSNRILDLWTRSLEVPASQEVRLIHGDLHPRNVLVDRGKFTGIIDWGDTTSGDVATDLASLWMLFDDVEVRNEAIERYGASDQMCSRARGWAIYFASVLTVSGLVDHPQHLAIGRSIFERLESEVA